MNKCKKCGSEFTPQKGLVNYCSVSCKNSRTWTAEQRKQKAKILKQQHSNKKWKDAVTKANKSSEKIQSTKETWKNKLDWKSGDMYFTTARRWLREEISECQECGMSEWRGNPLILEMHHIDGDNTNNKRENLTLLCPNCHSQTENWRGNKNKNMDF